MVQIWKMGNGFAVSIDGETARVVVEPTTGSHAPLSSDEKIIRALCSELAQAKEKAAAVSTLGELARRGYKFILRSEYAGTFTIQGTVERAKTFGVASALRTGPTITEAVAAYLKATGEEI